MQQQVTDAGTYAHRYLTDVVGVTGPVAAQYEQGLIIKRDLDWVAPPPPKPSRPHRQAHAHRDPRSRCARARRAHNQARAKPWALGGL
jgi:hypothetical protein